MENPRSPLLPLTHHHNLLENDNALQYYEAVPAQAAPLQTHP